MYDLNSLRADAHSVRADIEHCSTRPKNVGTTGMQAVSGRKSKEHSASLRPMKTTSRKWSARANDSCIVPQTTARVERMTLHRGMSRPLPVVRPLFDGAYAVEHTLVTLRRRICD
jgi:hypothetical protein